jgi:hypothetical protein
MSSGNWPCAGNSDTAVAVDGRAPLKVKTQMIEKFMNGESIDS